MEQKGTGRVEILVDDGYGVMCDERLAADLRVILAEERFWQMFVNPYAVPRPPPLPSKKKIRKLRKARAEVSRDSVGV